MKILFFLIILLSILFYGVVGKDKTWILAPCIMINHLFIFIWLLKNFFKNKKLSFNDNNTNFLLTKDLILWFIFLIFSIILYFSSSIQFESKKEVFYLSAVLGGYYFWRNSLSKFKYKTTFLGIFLTIIMLLALYGIVIHFKYPDTILWTTRYTDHYLGRLCSTYICPNHFAHLLQMLLPFCICYLFIPKGSFYLKCICIYSFIVFLFALFLTESRAGWLGAIASISVILCAFSLLKSKRLFFSILLVIPILISLIFIFSWNYSETFQRRMMPVVTYLQDQNIGSKGSDSKDFRPQTWNDTINMISDKPLMGFGPGTYEYTFQKYRESFLGERIITGHPHNEYLELIADYGIIGFILFSLSWIYTLFLLVKSSIHHKKLKYKFMSIASLGMMIGTMIHSFFDFQMHIFPNAATFSFLLALGFKDSEANIISKINFNRKAFLIFVLGSLMMLILCIQLNVSSLFLSLSKNYYSNNASSNALARKYALISFNVDNGNWESIKNVGFHYSNIRYYSLFEKEKLINAQNELEYFKSAQKLNPYDAEIYVGLAKPLIFLGKYYNKSMMIDHGIENLRIACSFKKYNNIYSWLLASELRKNNNFEESLKIFKGMKKSDLKSSIDANINWLENKLGADKKNNFNEELNVNYNLNKINIVDFLKEKIK